MESGYMAVYIAAVLILLFCIIKAGRSGKKIASTVRNVLFAAEIAVLANLVLALADSEMICMTAYSVFFISIDVLLYHVMLFTVRYTKEGSKSVVLKRIMQFLLALDGVSLLLNSFFEHAFSAYRVPEVRHHHYRIIPYAPYQLHLVLCYFLIAVSIFYLIKKVLKSSVPYQSKYFLVLLSLFGVVILDAVYVFQEVEADGAMFAFSLAGLVVYYYSLVYVPKGVIKQTLSLVVQEMGDAVLVFDVDGNCIHANNSARELFEIAGSDVEKLDKGFSGWCHLMDPKERRDYEQIMTATWGGKVYHVKVEFRRLMDKRNRYMGCFFIFQDRTEEEARMQKEHYRATHDALTGLYNKEYFYERVRECLEKNKEEEYYMVCSDIKEFKLINDVFGTRTGDNILIEIANALKDKSLEGDIYCRLESDKFGLFMKKSRFMEQMFIHYAQEAIRIDSDVSYPVHIYVGVYGITDQSIPVSVMCDRAFMALNSIKEDYRRKIAYYDETLRERGLLEQKLTGELEEALETGQFQIYLQPQMMAEGRIYGAEALVRWLHPRKGIIPPVEFIGIFEKNGLITKLDQYIWERACMQLKKWKDEGKNGMSLSVNISPKDFYYTDLYHIFTELVEKYDIDPGCLNLEITESAVMMDLEKQLDLIERLQSYGFVVEMDDFGSGYSSLNMLKDIRVDVLKIDMAFLGRTKDEERSRKILQMVVALSKQLEVGVIIEGVETEEQVDYLSQIGCDVFQGYFFAKPMQVSEFEKRYMNT